MSLELPEVSLAFLIAFRSTDCVSSQPQYDVLEMENCNSIGTERRNELSLFAVNVQ